LVAEYDVKRLITHEIKGHSHPCQSKLDTYIYQYIGGITQVKLSLGFIIVS